MSAALMLGQRVYVRSLDVFAVINVHRGGAALFAQKEFGVVCEYPMPRYEKDCDAKDLEDAAAVARASL